MTRQLLQATLSVRFFCTAGGSEPVREWLKGLDQAERKAIGEEIKTVQFGWPLGMPLVRKMSKDLWEIRVTLPTRIARVFFTVVDDAMVLLHGVHQEVADHTAGRSRRRKVSTESREQRHLNSACAAPVGAIRDDRAAGNATQRSTT